MGGPPIRIMIVDDHELVRTGVRQVVGATDDIVVCGEAGSRKEALAVAASARPDIVLMDVRLGDGSGIHATRDIRSSHPTTRVLMLTSFPDEEALFASIIAGASGFVIKDIKGTQLIEAIRAIAGGGNLLDPHVTAIVLDRLRRGNDLKDEKLGRLSAREQRVLGLIADGWTNAEIAEELHLSEKTVRNYVSVILQKLEVARRAQAAAYFSRTQAGRT